MPSSYDLSLAPDSRFLRFQSEYTTEEHLLSLREELRRGQSGASDALTRISGQASDGRWALEAGVDRLGAGLEWVAECINDGFAGMRKVFIWGMARLAWEHEQDRNVYKQILDALVHPLATQALELRQRAERSVRNEWWGEAVADLQASTQANAFDYLAHLQLARVLFFQLGQTDSAMQHFRLAARYADEVDAPPEQRSYGALAYGHIALLLRLEADLDAEHRGRLLREATEASRRARSDPPGRSP